MKFEICACCGKIIENEVCSCKTCGAKYCETCHKQKGDTCSFCGRR